MTDASERKNAEKSLADKITAKAEETLARLEHEMTFMKWPAEFRGIMWEAVAIVATQRAKKAKGM